MDRLFATLAAVVIRFRFVVVALWIVAAVVASRTLPSLSSEINNDNSQFLPASAPSQQAATLAAPLLGDTSTTSAVLVVASAARRSLTAADESAIAEEVVALRRVTGVVQATETKVSPNGQAAQVLVKAGVGPSDIHAQTALVDRLQRTFSQVRAPPGLEFHLTGNVATNVANQRSSGKTGGRVQALSFLLIIALLLAIFRAPLAAVVTLIPPVFALLVSSRLIGALGAHGLKISEITDLLLIVLLLGAGTDYGLFLVFRTREAALGGASPADAVAHALVRVGESISASAGTVILALLTLLLASFGVYRDLGVPLAIGMAVMLVAGLTLLPALLAIFGRATFWPRRSRAGGGPEHSWWGRTASRLVRRPAVTLGIGLVLFLGLATAALGYHSGGFGGAITAPAGSSVARGNAIVATDFPQSSTNPANLVLRFSTPVWDRPDRLAQAQSSLRQSGQFTALASALDPNGTTLTPAQYGQLHRELGPPRALPPVEPAGLTVSSTDYEAYRATAVFVSPDGKTVQFEAALRAGGQQTTAALDATPAVRHAVTVAAQRSGATAQGVAGEAAALYDVSSASNRDLLHIIPVAIVAIAVLLALVLRSLVAPMYLIVSVALSYAAALGLATLVFLDIAGEQGLTFILPFLMFIFLLALGEDYNILVMTRIREEAHHRPLRGAVVEAVGRTGPTVSSAGLILAGTFAVVALAGSSGPGGSQIRDIGFGLAVGILMDTFLVRTLLVPSTVALLGRWNWWPARLGRQHEQLPTGAAEQTAGSAPPGVSPPRPPTRPHGPARSLRGRPDR